MQRRLQQIRHGAPFITQKPHHSLKLRQQFPPKTPTPSCIFIHEAESASAILPSPSDRDAAAPPASSPLPDQDGLVLLHSSFVVLATI
jgi:hypothetical protein